MQVKLKSLSKNEDFKFILNGKKISNKYSTIFYRRLENKSNRYFNISFITKKKIGTAVIRNKIKRRLRNMMNEALKKIKINLNYSYLLIARKSVLEDEYNFIKIKLFSELKKIRSVSYTHLRAHETEDDLV